jgi:PhnB protein
VSNEQPVVPHLVINGAARAIDFYIRALGAHEVSRSDEPNGPRVLHAELVIGDSTIFICDDFAERDAGRLRHPHALGGVPLVLHRSVDDCDAAVTRAAQAGARVVMAPADQHWGERYAVIEDPFGFHWSFAHALVPETGPAPAEAEPRPVVKVSAAPRPVSRPVASADGMG